ncbi:peptide chain release factor N(5)-glutamine methyltransferase [Zhengella sp. ZM62]|uniref:peptide chain release factor N(5)-glutamine methyltransferase n=1 Tax=Zhengella sedimenti TaxID=3390035 RepID=UPI003974A845
MRLDALMEHCRRTLADAGVKQPGTDSRLLATGVLGLDATRLIADGDRSVCDEEAQRLLQAVARRAAGEPVHRILGYRPFRNLVLSLSPETLEPRPDTEILIDMVIPVLEETVRRGIKPRILDLGTGTGAILLALLDEVPQATGLGVDISADAVETARANARMAGLDTRATFRVSDWFSAVDGIFNVIVSNPPYIPSDGLRRLDREVRDHDPRAALDGGPDGLDPYRVLAVEAGRHLARDGLIAVEHGFDQRETVCRLFGESGYIVAKAARDLSGHDRVILFERL